MFFRQLPMLYWLHTEIQYDNLERTMNRDYEGGDKLHKKYKKLVEEICELKSQ